MKPGTLSTHLMNRLAESLPVNSRPVLSESAGIHIAQLTADAAPPALQVLLVDDDDVDRMAVSRALARAGTSVDLREARDASETMSVLSSGVFDCIILDYDIPGADGLTLLRTIRARGIRTPVIMLTGVGDEQVAVELMKAGAVDYLPKAALTPDRLNASLRYAMELTRATRAAEQAGQELRDSVERARVLATEAQRARFRTERLQQLTERLAAVTSVVEVAELFVEQVRDAMEFNSAAVALLSPDRSELVTIAHVGFGDELSSRLRRPTNGASPSLDVLRDGQPRWYSSRASLNAAYPQFADSKAFGSLEALMVLPLDLGSGPFGVIGMGFSYRRELSDDEKALAITLARQCAQGIERSRLYEAERAARDEAVEANRAKSEFLARMSHDLRTPLNAIGGYTQLLELGVHGTVAPAQLEALARIRRAQEHLLTLINDILGFARIEAGQVRLELESVPLDDAIRHVIELIEPQARSKGLEFVATPRRKGLLVHADRERLVQVLLNLISNAVKFTDSPGRISVEWNDAGEHAIVRVNDTGRGIALERLDAIFDPFVQEGKVAGDSQSGVGLGLAISRDLARLMDAELTVESSLGSGSTFTLTLQRV